MFIDKKKYFIVFTRLFLGWSHVGPI